MKHFGAALVAAGAQFISESYVSSPPAAWIVDSAGNVFELGNKRFEASVPIDFREKYATDPRGQFAFNVLLNGADTGEYASAIERRNGKIRIFTRDGGWKIFNGRSFV